MKEGRAEDLRRADGVIIEAREAANKLATPLPGGGKQSLKIGDTLELNDHRRVVVGLAEPSRTFMWFPMVYTTYSRALEMAPPERRTMTYVLVKVAAGEDHQQVAERIAATTGMAALTQKQFRNRTVDFILHSTGIAINFKISMALGFLVGCAIAGQTFFNFVHDNLRHLGALKAMGARNRQLVAMILIQAGVSGLIGYGFGVGAAALFGMGVKGTELAFLLSADRMIFSGIAVLVVVLLSSALAMRAVIRLEPAVVFRS